MQLAVLTITRNWKDEIVRRYRWTVEGDTLEKCFEAAYQTERSYRYCNDTNIEFENPEAHKQYLAWKQHGLTIEMYYGNGTVD